MDQSRRLLAVWNRLPAFQAVAESEHLPTASLRLHVTASALSRTIRMLEGTLGRVLFNRRGRTITLNADGRRLLGSVVRAMQALGTGLDALFAGDPVGPLYVSASGALAQTLAVPALRELQDHNRSILPHVYSYDRRELAGLLRTGQLDVSFSSSPLEEPGLESILLGEAGCSVHCGRTHPLYQTDRPSRQDVLAFPFVVSCSPRSDAPDDGFPPDIARRIDIFVGQAEVAIQLCVREQLLAVLPDFAARARVEEGSLRRLPLPAVPPVRLFATYLDTANARRRSAPLVDALRDALTRAISPQSTHLSLPPRPPSDHPDGDDAWLALGDTLFFRAEYRAARKAFEKARRARQAEGELSPLDEARYAWRLAKMDVRRGRYVEAEATCADAIRRVGAADPVATAALEAMVSLARSFRGDTRGAEEWLALARARLADEATVAAHPDGPRARALLFRAEGNWLLETGRPREAAMAYERGHVLCNAMGDAWERSIALFNMAEAWSGAGDFEQAGKLLDAAGREKTEIRDRWGNAYVHGARGAMLVLLQQPASAVREITSGLQLAADLDDPKLLSMLNATLGVAQFACDDARAAQQAFKLCLRDAERCDARNEAIRAWLGLCAVALRQRKLTVARRAAEKAHGLAAESSAASVIGVTLFALGDVAVAHGDTERAAELYRAAFRSAATRSPAFSPFDLSGPLLAGTWSRLT